MSQGQCGRILGPIIPKGGARNPAPESAENSLEPHSHPRADAVMSTLLITDKASEKKADVAGHPEESWGELFSLATLCCFPSQEIKAAGASFQQGWRMECTLEIRCHLSLERWGHQTPHHLPHLMPKRHRIQQESRPMKSYPVSSKPTYD